MHQCPNCGTKNDYVYIGFTSIECTNVTCRNHDEQAELKFLAAQEFKNYTSSIYAVEDESEESKAWQNYLNKVLKGGIP